MRFAVSLIAYYIEMFVAVDYCSSTYELKRKKGTMWLYAFLLYSAGFAAFSLFENIFINIVVFLLINISFIGICFDAKIYNAILSSFLLSSFMVCAEFIFIFGSEVTRSGTIVVYSNNVTTYTVGSILSKLLYFLLTKLTSRWSFKVKRDKRLNVPVFMFIFPLCGIMFFYLFWMVSSLVELPIIFDLLVSATSIIITIGIIFSYYFYDKAQQTVDELYTAQAQAEKTKVDIAYYAILDRQNEQLKTIIHDEKNHLATIKSLSDNKEINDYIDRLCGEIKVSSLFGNTENKMLDLVLNKYSYICENDEIRFNVTAKTANLTFIENTDLVTVMSNMLDNAVEAAKVSAEKYIDLSINRTNGFDIITCTNSCDKAPAAKGDVLNTTKNDGVFHGLGVKSIKKIVSRYKGSFEWSYDMNEKEFVVYIAFKN